MITCNYSFMPYILGIVSQKGGVGKSTLRPHDGPRTHRWRALLQDRRHGHPAADLHALGRKAGRGRCLARHTGPGIPDCPDGARRRAALRFPDSRRQAPRLRPDARDRTGRRPSRHPDRTDPRQPPPRRHARTRAPQGRHRDAQDRLRALPGHRQCPRTRRGARLD